MSRPSGPKAVIELLTRSVRPGDELGYRINNTDSVQLICGLPYRLEQETSDGWVPMNNGMAFPLIGFGVLPGESWELKARIPADARAGAYRLSTSVSSDHARGSIRLLAHFDVVRDR